MKGYSRLSWYIIVFVFLLLASVSIAAFENTFRLSALDGTLELNGGISYLEDLYGRLNFEDIQKSLQHGSFSPSHQHVLNFVYSHSSYWFYPRLENTLDKGILRYLEFSYPLLDYLDYSNSDIKLFNTKDKRPYDTRLIIYNRFFIPIELKCKESVDVFIRLDTLSLAQLPLILWTQEELLETTHKEQIALGGYLDT